MTDQEILDNAPEGATHYDCDEYMRHVHDGFWEYFSKADGWNETKPEEETRSLADIKRIAELEDLAQMIIDAESADPRVISLMYNAWLHKAKSLKEQE